MREIEFRGFHKDTNGTETIYIKGQAIKGNWVYGNHVYIKYKNRHYIIDFNTNIYNENKFGDIKEIDIIEVIPETVGQYTDVLDKNGKKIFENDVLVHREHLEDGTYIEEYDYVFWDNGMFKVAIKFLETDDEILGDYLLRIDKSNVDYEVVGTIFDKEVK